MMTKHTFILSLLLVGLSASCVSKKKFTSLQGELNATQVELANITTEKDRLEEQFAAIEQRVAEYNARINSLRDDNVKLQGENDEKMSLNGQMLMSKSMRDQLHRTLAEVDPEKLAKAETMEDSVNLAISHNLMRAMSGGDPENQEEDIVIDIDKTVVMISVSDKLMFNTGSYRVSNTANNLLERLAEVIKSEPSMEVMVEGHTDSRSISTAVLQDNWDLSVKRATSIVRKLVNDYQVSPEQLIAAGRSSYFPIV
jgi:chemotaxis protein MotB